MTEQLRAQIADEKLRADRATQQAKELSKKTYQQALAQKCDIIDTDVATTMLKDNLRFDPELKTHVATNPDGTTRLNADGSVMLGETLYQEFSAAKPWLVGSSVVPGTGSSGSGNSIPPRRITAEQVFGRSSSSQLANDLAKRNYPEYQRLKREAIAKGMS